MIERKDIPQYNTAFDSQRFTALMAQRGTVGFESQLAQETSYIRTQLKTDLGERLHVAKSTFVYEIRDGKLYEPGRTEPMEDVIRRGMGRNQIDRGRDQAEIRSFTGVIQEFLVKDDTPDGTTILAVSPRGKEGTFEEKNFFRVFVREGRFVLGASYFSDLSNSDYRKKILSINPSYSELIPEKPTDVDLKSTPVIIPKYLDCSANPDSLAAFILDGRQVGIPQEELEQVWIDVAPLTTSFINTLVERPWALAEVEEGYQGILGGAYHSHEHGKTESGQTVVGETIFASHMRTGVSFSGTPMEIKMLAEDSKKMGGGACGSGSCSTETSSGGVPSDPWDNFDGGGNMYFRCKCGALNKRELFSYVTNCQKCGSDEVLPPNLRGKPFQPGLAMKQ